jgi:hypothetical protein
MSDIATTTGNPPAPAAAPKSFAQQRLAQDQAAADKLPPPETNKIDGFDKMSFEQRRLAQDQRAGRIR